MDDPYRKATKIAKVVAHFADSFWEGQMWSRSIVILFVLSTWASNSYAFFFIFPIPNTSKPPALQKIIDALENSKETKAIAYVSEDKTFGSKYWTWGYASGHMSQADANSEALSKCEANLGKVKLQSAGGQPLYDFGNKHCELHVFTANNSAQPGDRSPFAPVPSGTGAGVPSTQPASVTAVPTPLPPNSAQPVETTKTSSEAAPSAAANKLKELKSLFDQGLITKEEYDEKRKAILQSM